MYGAILGDMIGSPYEFDMGDKTKEFPLFSKRSCFTDDSVTTPEGIMLGSTRDEVIAAYGSSFTEENGNTIYTKGKTELRFRFSENGVTAIEYWAIEN